MYQGMLLEVLALADTEKLLRESELMTWLYRVHL